VNFIDFSGLSSLILAVEYDLPGTMKCLLDAGANPNIPDEVSFIVSAVINCQDAFHAYTRLVGS
jgi:hypothetical protein